MPRILVIDHRVATPDQDSGSLRMVKLLRVLHELGHSVTYLPQSLGNRVERGRYSDLTRKFPFHPTTESSVARHLRRQPRTYELTWLCRLGTAERFLPRLRRSCPTTQIVFDTVDLHHLRELRQSEIEQNPRLRAAALDVRDRELEVVDNVDATLVVSTAEAALLRRQNSEALIRVVSNIHEISPPGPGFENRRGLVFIAGFQHAPNVDAARWLATEIMPWVWRQLPDLPLAMVGSHPPTEVLDLRSELLEVTGAVPDLSPILDQARLSLAPLRFGAGVKGKITQSMAAGLPVVATRLACEGMPIESEKDILMADRPQAFAASVIRAYGQKELWHRLADHGREAARKYFSLEAARGAITSLFDELADRRGRPTSDGS